MSLEFKGDFGLICPNFSLRIRALHISLHVAFIPVLLLLGDFKEVAVNLKLPLALPYIHPTLRTRDHLKRHGVE